MSDRDRNSGLLGTVFAILSGVIVSLAVGVWALGTPGNDPVGAAAVTAGTFMEGKFRWLRAEPENVPQDWVEISKTVRGGDPQRGATLIAQYGCGSCHVVPGVARAHGTVGPDLSGFRDRAYIGGVLSNEPGDLVDWLMNPTTHAPDTAMPDLGVTETDARHMASYLYTLRGS
ncbi:c-type cytochrome [Marivita sp.]|uniref:c-type cytochrome n=1 Tax=Marivita sp. TaxID=2003365 RepID=UPI0025BB9664|nr:c-type cytochrome [Marivita sp.]